MVTDVDWYTRQQQIEELDAAVAQNKREIAERRERRLIEEAMNPLPVVDFSRCKSVGEMSSAEFTAWCDAGRPELAADRAAREGAALARRVAKETAAAPAAPPAPASGLTETDWRMLGEEIGEEVGRAERETRRYCDQRIADVRAEIAMLRAEIKVRNEVEALRSEIEQLRGERRGLRAVT